MLGAVCLGCGSLLARAAGTAIPAPLLLPCGFSVVVVVAGLATALPATAELALPSVVGLAAIGLCLLPRRLPGADARMAALVATMAFALVGAPVFLSGDPTFSGYVKLDDTATFLAFADHVLTHGRDLSELSPSTHEATLAVNVANGYPLGSILPLAIGSRLVGSDPAWVWQPFISFAAGLLALSLYALARQVLRSRAAAAGVALLASQSALLYGYALWGGVKEVVAAALLALAATALGGRYAGGARAALVPAASLAAFLGVMSLGGAVWLVPLAAATVVAARRAVRIRTALALVVLTAMFAVPALSEARSFLRRDNVGSFRAEAELGNLVRPLRVRQVLGIWPAADFRADPGRGRETTAILVLALTGGGLGIALAVRRKSLPILALAAAGASGTTVFVLAGSPWLAGKALAIASPSALLLVALGLAALRPHQRTLAVGLGGIVVAGVAWSNVLAYRGVWLAPYDQLRELELIGERFAGQGPALMTEYQPYGVRHFLRRLEAEGASELRRRQVRLTTGGLLEKGAYADLDEFDLTEIRGSYRLLVLRRSPVSSRPPAAYSLLWRGAWYDVWRRTAGFAQSEHLALGRPLDRLGTPDCRAVEQLAAGSAAGLLAPRPAEGSVQGIGNGSLPSGWDPAGVGTGNVVPSGAGAVSVVISIPSDGSYGVWVGGSVRGSLRTFVDGRRVGSADPHINWQGMWLRLGTARLRSGSHEVRLRVEPHALRPGSGAEPFALGPVALAQEPDGALVQYDSAAAAALCATRVDWIEMRSSG